MGRRYAADRARLCLQRQSCRGSGRYADMLRSGYAVSIQSHRPIGVDRRAKRPKSPVEIYLEVADEELSTRSVFPPASSLFSRPQRRRGFGLQFSTFPQHFGRDYWIQIPELQGI